MASAAAAQLMRPYQRLVLLADVVALAVGFTLAALIQFGDFFNDAVEVKSLGKLRFALGTTHLAVLMVVLWLVVLVLIGSRNRRIVGTGTDEYRKIGNSALIVVGVLAGLALFFKLDVSRPFVIYAVVISTLLVVIGRRVSRVWLVRARRRGRFLTRVAIVGPANLTSEILETFARDKECPFRVELLIVHKASDARALKAFNLPTLVELGDPAALMKERHLDAIIMVSSDATSASYIRRVGWNLEDSPFELIVAPGVLESMGPRIHARPVAGLPLIEVESPSFNDWRFVVKQTFDFVGAAVLTVLLSPVFLATAIAIKAGDRGPVLYSQERIGINGRVFKMLKFRSMRPGAESDHAALKANKLQTGGLVNTNMFKDPNDPRVTRVGRFIRRYSIDELPQLFNVLGGDMSLVGPRPPLPSEVAEYEAHMHRRLLVKPGVTGVWQVSGRATLSWKETVRLDLDYVENWSLLYDAVILLKTVREVIRPAGGY
jgi:exopolysaccharide biosynthesis polyprenyl glycosylphosphotransferase